MTTEGPGPRVSLRARELREGGAESLAPLPTPEQLAAEPSARRAEVLGDLRVELYAISSLVADEVVRRARRLAPSYPPYGLVRSMHSVSRMVLADPDPVARGAIDSFRSLGMACVDTTVFHLHATLGELRHSTGAWMLPRLEALLALFREGAAARVQERMRDAASFVYGGLHFGTGVCVQLAEVMWRLLTPITDLDARQRSLVMAASIRPALRLAALNVDQVVGAYQHLQAEQPAGWMDARCFEVVRLDDGRWRIDLRDDGLAVSDAPTTWPTLGCPARTSPTGGPSPIAALWAWCAELAESTGLLDEEPDRSSR